MTTTHLDLGKPFAINLLPAGTDAGSRVARFEREAGATSRLESEHAAHIVDFGGLDDESA